MDNTYCIFNTLFISFSISKKKLNDIYLFIMSTLSLETIKAKIQTELGTLNRSNDSVTIIAVSKKLLMTNITSTMIRIFNMSKFFS